MSAVCTLPWQLGTIQAEVRAAAEAVWPSGLKKHGLAAGEGESGKGREWH